MGVEFLELEWKVLSFVCDKQVVVLKLATGSGYVRLQVKSFLSTAQ